MSTAALAAIALQMDDALNDAASLAMSHPTLEMQEFVLNILLKCNQVSKAEKMLAGMSSSNDDSAAYKMANAAVKIVTGDAKEAYLTYCDLAGQLPSVEDDARGSVLLQTAKAVANMHRGMFPEAEEELKGALELAPTNPDVLTNLCACAVHLQEQKDFQAYYAKLEQVSPDNPYVIKTQGISSVFQRFTATLPE